MMLAGRHVLVTRPAAESGGLEAALREGGAVPVMLPAIDIQPIDDPAVLQQITLALYADDIVFVSPSAVRVFYRLVSRFDLARVPLAATPAPSAPMAAATATALPAAAAASAKTTAAMQRVFAVGPGTVRVLRDHGVVRAICPREQHDAAGVAALPELTVLNGRTVAIVAGVGGRTGLADALNARGARLIRVECYRRAIPSFDIEALMSLGRSGSMDAVIVTSSVGLGKLWQALDARGRTTWESIPTFMPHERIVAAARALGLRQVVLTGSTDTGILAALNRFFG